MKKLLLFLLCCTFAMPILAKQSSDTIRLSQLFKENTIPLYEPNFLLTPAATIYDTIKISFVLVNDSGADTSIYCMEGPNDFHYFYAVAINGNAATISKVSGRNYYGKIPYINFYYPAQKIKLQANTAYRCIVQWKSNSYKGVRKSGGLLTIPAYLANLKEADRFRYTNNIITYFFTGAIFFGFFLFLFLYYKSRYPLFGMYAAFLFLQGIYGIILFDVYTLAGSLFITHFSWDEYVTEMVVFAGQAIYVQFIIGWLQMKQVSSRLVKVFHLFSVFFAVYAFSFFLIYTIAPEAHVLNYIKAAVRILGMLFQLFLFYHIFFTIKTAGRWYIFTGNLLLMILGIIMIFIRSQGGFENSWLEDIDNASWYMLGVMAENLCFTMGMGQHYFELQSEKNRMQIAALNARQAQLETQENNLKDRLRISQDLHDSIGSTLSSIAVYSQVANIHSEKNEKAELHELLEKISGTSNEMVGEMNDIVWAINPRNDSLEKIILRMESFAKPLAAARNIHFDLTHGTEIATLQLDMEQRKNFYLVFKEAVNNAIKYSGATALQAHVSVTKYQLILQVTDNGVGFNPEIEMANQSTSLSGNGLRNMHNRAALLQGTITITTAPSKGTVITLQMPI